MSVGDAFALLHPGDRLDLTLPVRLAGNGTSIDVEGSTLVRVRVLALPPLDPGLLMYSDDPENVPAGSDGVLFRDSLASGESARAYLYHTSLVAGRHLTLVLRSMSGPARVQVLGAAAGPSGDYLATGHVATADYLRERRAQESAVVDLEQGRPFLLPLSGTALAQNDLVAAIFDTRVLTGGPITGLRRDDRRGRSGRFSRRAAGPGRRPLSHRNVRARSAAARSRAAHRRPRAAPLAVGSPKVTTLRAPRPLAGGYGVVQRLTISLDNASGPATDVYLYEIPNGNAVTTTLFFDGDPAPLEIPCVKTAGVRYLVRRFSLAAGQKLDAAADYMTDGASSYPVQLGLSTIAPQNPDACASGQSG